MPAEKPFIGRVNEHSSDKTRIAEQLNLIRSTKFNRFPGMPGFGDQFYKLIEYDEGVPFHIMFSKETGDGHYIMIGKGIEQFTGIRSSDFTDQTFRNMIEEIVPLSDNIPADITNLRRKLLNGEIGDYRLEVRITAADGEKRWIRETALTLKDEVTGEVTGAVGILHDVSEKRRVMSYLDEARERDCESERLSTTFLQNISHEVRTPLNAIVGFSSLLCEPGDSYYRKKEFIDMINNSADHFLEIMDNIMEISSIETGSSQVSLNLVEPATIMARIYRTFIQRAEERGIELICTSTGNDQLTVMTDSYKLFQILNNLIGNALKFTFTGKVEFGYVNKASYIEFYITDTCIGISEACKNMIFNKFYQADSGSTRRFPGVGLGLPIAKAYIEMLGGNISFVSGEGKGSTFRFTLPKTS